MGVGLGSFYKMAGTMVGTAESKMLCLLSKIQGRLEFIWPTSKPNRTEIMSKYTNLGF